MFTGGLHKKEHIGICMQVFMVLKNRNTEKEDMKKKKMKMKKKMKKKMGSKCKSTDVMIIINIFFFWVLNF